MKQELERLVEGLCKQLFNVDLQVGLTRPDEQFGDFATNVALQLAKQLKKNPAEVAEELRSRLKHQYIAEATIAGPGFINIKLKDDALLMMAHAQPTPILSGQNIVVEYSDPNPFKVLHAGHLYTSVVGDGIAELLEAAGAKVHRVNFGGDVGLHVGKTMWAILGALDGENPDKLQQITDHAEWLTERYVEGNAAYEENEAAKEEIVALNKRVYQLHAEQDKTSAFAQIYWTTRQWSYDYFEAFYVRIGTRFEKYYPESETAPLGLAKAQELLTAGVLEKSEGAVVFKGENHGLHTRVFINSAGLPTYETKDLGLTVAKDRDYKPDKSVIITGNDIAEYMKVVVKVVEQFDPEHAKNTVHLTHGMVKLAGGEKMSSRKGNILRAVDVIDAAREANQKTSGKDDESTALAAVKYAFLKTRMGGDILYDPEESVALEGNSGPYLQYAHARARSILAKAKSDTEKPKDLQAGERPLIRKIGEFAEVVDKAAGDFMPHHICTYLYELAQAFNNFYEHNRVLDDPRQAQRLHLVQLYADTLKGGLELLKIPAPDRM